jgi:hypothetical protein
MMDSASAIQCRGGHGNVGFQEQAVVGIAWIVSSSFVDKQRAGMVILLDLERQFTATGGRGRAHEAGVQ